jgi:Leucine-rich repeat (LRR) protein
MQGQKETVAAESSSADEQNLETNNTEEYIVIGGYKTDYRTSYASTRTDRIYVTIGEGYSADFSGIEIMPNLTELSIVLRDTRYVDFSPVRTLSKLEKVRLGGWGVTAIPDLGGLPLLTYLVITYASISSLDGIEKIPSLEWLAVGNNHEYLADISALRHLKNLRRLNLHSEVGGGIDFLSIGDMPSLKDLDIYTVGTDLAGISQLKSLEKLYVGMSNLDNTSHKSLYKNLEEIGKMTWLRELEINDAITSIEFLANNVNLEELRLNAGRDRKDFWSVLLPLDVSPLRNLPNLKYLAIRGFEPKNLEALDRLLPNLDFVTFSLSSHEEYEMDWRDEHGRVRVYVDERGRLRTMYIPLQFR